MPIAELKLRIDAQPGLDELEDLIATLEEACRKTPNLILEIGDLLFSGSDNGIKPGFVELVAVSAGGAGSPSVIQLHVTDRLRELVSAAVANELQLLSIN